MDWAIYKSSTYQSIIPLLQLKQIYDILMQEVIDMNCMDRSTIEYLSDLVKSLKDVNMERPIRRVLVDQFDILGQIRAVSAGIFSDMGVNEGDVPTDNKRALNSYINRLCVDSNYKKGTKYDSVFNYLLSHADRTKNNTVLVNYGEIARELGKRPSIIRANFSNLTRKGLIEKVGTRKGFLTYFEYKINDDHGLLGEFSLFDKAILYYLLHPSKSQITHHIMCDYFNVSKRQLRITLSSLQGRGAVKLSLSGVRVLEPFRSALVQEDAQGEILDYLSSLQTKPKRSVGGVSDVTSYHR